MNQNSEPYFNYLTGGLFFNECLEFIRIFKNGSIFVSYFDEIKNIMKAKKFFTHEEEQTARFAKAMSHPVRVYILNLLSRQTCCFSGDLADDLPIARSTLSQHLKELKASGLIQGTIEYPKIRYCINKENWKLAGELFGKLLQSTILIEYGN